MTALRAEIRVAVQRLAAVGACDLWFDWFCGVGWRRGLVEIKRYVGIIAVDFQCGYTLRTHDVIFQRG